MNRHLVSVIRFGRPGAMVLCAALAATLGLPHARAQNTAPAEFQGTWVPKQASCESPLRMVVAADRVTLTNGKDSQSLGGIDMAGPGFFPPNYRGIQAVLFTEFSGHQPVIVTFNAGEKKGAALAEYSPVQPAPKPTAQLKAYNAHISKLNLAKRFPLDKAPLKKCS